MQVDGKQMRPIWLDTETDTVKVIDQRKLPHELVVLELQTVDDVITAIREMVVRGAPLIGVTGAYGVFIAAKRTPEGPGFTQRLSDACHRIRDARPTAVNLAWAVDRVHRAVTRPLSPRECIDIARAEAGIIAAEEVKNCKNIGMHGLKLIEAAREKKGSGVVNILTHCNAGWLACVEYGTATAPIYAAAEAGLDVHVWVDETRPLNQGARLTAWELGKCGIAHTVITDNAGGHLMQHGLVDLVIVGTDRTTYTGDVANKIGTYLKALAAKDNGIPFYVALPSSTFDWHIADGVRDIPIEERDPDEVRYVSGLNQGETGSVLILPADSRAANYAFDVTPARLVTAFITEKGVCEASPEGIGRLFPGRGGMNELEKKIIASVQADIPITARPYLEIAAELGISEESLLAKLDQLCRKGVIRRFGATLRHQKSGFAANAMVAWRVAEDRIEEVGNAFAGFQQVSHCYRRNPMPQWPYNLYTMVHALDQDACRQTAHQMALAVDVTDYALLFSERELKKTSMLYFPSDEDEMDGM